MVVIRWEARSVQIGLSLCCHTPSFRSWKAGSGSTFGATFPRLWIFRCLLPSVFCTKSLYLLHCELGLQFKFKFLKIVC